MSAQKKAWKSIDPAFYMLLPTLILLFIFMVVPVFRVLLISFFDPDFTLQHYLKFYKVSIYFQVFLRTITISLMVSACCLIIGYPVSYLMAEVSENTARILLIFVVLPMWTGVLIRTYAWMVLLGRNGFLNKMLIYFDLIAEPIKILYTTKAVVLAMVHILLPLMILPLYATMKGIDRNLLKASNILGANPLQTFLRISLPLSTPGVLAGFTLVFILSMAFFITPALVGGRTDIMIAMLIETQITKLLNWGFAGALSLILMVTTLIIVLVFNKLVGINQFIDTAER